MADSSYASEVLPEPEFGGRPSGDPFFSIIIPAYEALADLSRCVESLNVQTHRSFEVLISDGGSSDGTEEYLRSGKIMNLGWAKAARDLGIYHAMNEALKNAHGRWVLVLGADDKLLSSTALTDAQAQIEALPEDVAIAYGDLFIARGATVTRKAYPEYSVFSRKYWGGAFIHHQSAFVRLCEIRKQGGFSCALSIHADYDLLLAISKNARVAKISGAFVCYSANGYSSKLRNLGRSLREVMSIRRRHGYWPLPPRILAIYLRMLWRHAAESLRAKEHENANRN